MKNKLKMLKRKFLTTKTARFITNLIFLAIAITMCMISLHYVIKIIILVFSFLIYLITVCIIDELEKEKDALPIATERYTKKRPDGSVVLDTNRFQEAILYLYEIEDKLYK